MRLTLILSEDSTPSAQHAPLAPLLTLKSKFLEHKPLGVTNKPYPNHSRPKNLVEVSTHAMHAETKEQEIYLKFSMLTQPAVCLYFIHFNHRALAQSSLPSLHSPAYHFSIFTTTILLLILL